MVSDDSFWWHHACFTDNNYLWKHSNEDSWAQEISERERKRLKKEEAAVINMIYCYFTMLDGVIKFGVNKQLKQIHQSQVSVGMWVEKYVNEHESLDYQMRCQRRREGNSNQYAFLCAVHVRYVCVPACYYWSQWYTIRALMQPFCLPQLSHNFVLRVKNPEQCLLFFWESAHLPASLISAVASISSICAFLLSRPSAWAHFFYHSLKITKHNLGSEGACHETVVPRDCATFWLNYEKPDCWATGGPTCSLICTVSSETRHKYCSARYLCCPEGSKT